MPVRTPGWRLSRMNRSAVGSVGCSPSPVAMSRRVPVRAVGRRIGPTNYSAKPNGSVNSPEVSECPGHPHGGRRGDPGLPSSEGPVNG